MPIYTYAFIVCSDAIYGSIYFSILFVESDGGIFRNGTFLIVFVTFRDNEVIRSVRTGKWWVEKERFFETINEEAIVHEYVYAIDPENTEEISFKHIASDYNFKDCKIPGNHWVVLNGQH